jgi:hypothetical protein
MNVLNESERAVRVAGCREIDGLILWIAMEELLESRVNPGADLVRSAPGFDEQVSIPAGHGAVRGAGGLHGERAIRGQCEQQREQCDGGRRFHFAIGW